jgi:hypothetical protein
MARRLSKIATMVLLVTLSALGQQILLATMARQSAVPATCHSHQHQSGPPLAPSTHNCCAAGHNSAISAKCDIAAACADASREWLAAAIPTPQPCGNPPSKLVTASDSPPLAAPLRI